jgi:WD40 repeat protein
MPWTVRKVGAGTYGWQEGVEELVLMLLCCGRCFGAEMNGLDKLDKEALVLLSGHEKEVYACSWNPVKNILVSGSSDSTARVWALPNKVEDDKAVVPKVLNHGTGPHKDVTTLEWNVRSRLCLLSSRP